MKKLLTILFISTVMVFTACEGEDGEMGPQGPMGNANVKSEIIKVSGSDWTLESVGGGQQLSFEYDSPILTDDIIDNGSAHLYLKTVNNGDSIWLPLPISTVLYFLSPTDGLVIKSGNANHQNQTTSFRFVTIQGQMQAKVDFNNFEEVKARFNLED